MTPDRESPDVLESGLPNLDSKLASRGVQKGSVVSIVSPPESVGRLAMLQMAGERETLYLPFFGVTEQKKQLLTGDPGKVPSENLTIRPISPSSCHSDILDAVEDSECSSILIESMPILANNVNTEELLEILGTVKEQTEKRGGLSVLQGSSNTHKRKGGLHQDLAVQKSDFVFRIKHESDRNNLSVSLVIDRVHPFQELQDGENRVMQLDLGREVSINTKKKIQG